MRNLEKLAGAIAACVEDAKRPIERCDLSTWPMVITEGPDHRVICLCNALTAIEQALRTSIPSARREGGEGLIARATGN